MPRKPLPKRNLQHFFRAMLGAASLWTAGILMVACGGGDLFSVVPGVGTGGTGNAAGTITGLGSVIVDGVRYDDSAAVLERQPDLLQSETLGLADLQVGQYVYLELDAAGVPTRVRLDSQLVGYVGNVVTGSGQFTVWGQTVTTNTDATQGPVTVFSGYTSLADMQAQDRVQVYGVLQNNADDTGHEVIRATRIERLASSSSLPARLSGMLRASSTTGLRLAGLPLDTSQTTNLTSVATLQAGQWVTVVLPWPTDASAAPTKWTALSLRTLTTSVSTDTPLRLSGAAQLGADGMLTLQGIKVDASAPALTGIRDGLAQGTYITVNGQVNHSSGKLVASSIETTPTGGRPMELRGSVTSVLDQTSFTVRGVQVNAAQAQWSGGTPAELVNGRYVEVIGNLLNNVFTASKVLLQTNLPDKAVLDITAVVQSVNSASRIAQVLTQDGQTLSVAFAVETTLPAVGESLRIDGFWADNLLQARDISAQPPRDRDLIRLEGIVDSASSGQFRLNGVLVQVDGVLFPTLKVSAGDRVEVQVRRSDEQYWLVEFDTRPPRR